MKKVSIGIMNKRGTLTVLAIVLLVVSVLWLFVAVTINTSPSFIGPAELSGPSDTGVIKVNVRVPVNSLGAAITLNVIGKGG